jgi:protocatechuate 3,4-dioxygenase beta subunit
VTATFAVLAVAAVGAVRFRAVAEEGPAGSGREIAPNAVVGVVSDADGKPARDAQIWLLEWRSDPKTSVKKAAVLGSTRTDLRGGFSFDDVDLNLNAPAAERPRVVCLRPASALTWCVADPSAEPLQLTLQDPEPVVGTILGNGDEPLAGAELRLTIIDQWDHAGGQRRWTGLILPDALQSVLTARSDETGAFSFDRLPPDVKPGFDISAEGYGAFEACLDGPLQPLHLRLSKATALTGRLSCPLREEAAGRRIWVYSSMEGSAAYGEGWQYRVSQTAHSDAAGRYVFPDLAPGVYRLQVYSGSSGKWLAGATKTLRIPAGGSPVQLDIGLRRALPVTGRVVHAKTGAPVAGVRTTAHLYSNLGDCETRTHDNGKFLFYALPGMVDVSFTAPEGHVRAGKTKTTVVVVEGRTTTVPDFMVKESATLRGVVVDERGQPVPGANVWEEAEARFSGDPRATTDANGHFEITGVPPGAPVKLHALAGRAVTARETVVDPSRETGLIRLVVSGDAAASVRGRVVDRQGKPCGAVVVFISRIAEYGAYRYAELRTDHDGRFESPTLIPGHRYRVVVGSPTLTELQAFGYNARAEQQHEWDAKAGKTLDLGDLTIPWAPATVAGMVVDSVGKPLAGAHVFTHDAPELRRLATGTDGQGRFRLRQVYEGDVHVFAQMPGYRLGGVRAQSGKADVRIVLRRRSEPRSKTMVRPVAPDLDRDRKLAVQVAQEGLAMTKGTRFLRQWDFVEAIIRADPAKGRELWERQGRTNADNALTALGQALTETSPREAVAYLVQIGDASRRARRLIEAGEAMSEADPQSAVTAFRQALAAARATSSIHERLMWESRAARGLVDLGQRDGQAVLARVHGEAKRLRRDYDGWKTRYHVATALCKDDLASASALLDGLPGDRTRLRDWLLCEAAAHVARTDARKAKQLLARIDSGGWDAALAVAKAVAPRDPEAALGIARDIAGPSQRAAALAEVARALAKTDAARAFALIDEAVEGAGSSTPPEPEDVARVAKTALDLGYPDTQYLVMRTLSLCSHGRQHYAAGEPFSGGRIIDARLLVPAELAQLDAPAARHLVERLLAETDVTTDQGRAAMSALVPAAACVDPQWARRLAADMPDDGVIEFGKPAPKANCYVELAFVLGLPPASRAEFISRGQWYHR